MFDEREFCNGFGPLEDDQIKAGPIGRFRYSRGLYEFLVAPDRIDVQCRQPDNLPEVLTVAARKVIARLEPARSVVPVSGIGFNCDVVFGTREIRIDGQTWCRSLTDTPRTRGLFPHSFASVVTFSFQSNGVRYAVRHEPDGQSQGENLLVAINGHQDLAATDSLEEGLRAVEKVRSQVAELHDRLRSSQGEKP